MKNIEDGIIYRLDHNGRITFAYKETLSVGEVSVFDTNRAWDITGYDKTETPDGLRYSRGDSYYEFSPLTLETAREVYPHTIRVFNDINVLERYAREAINMADSYAVNTAPEETVSFTVDENDNVLALIKVTDAGEMFYWLGEDWVEVGEDEDHPNIYDRTLIDVERADIGEALELFKSVPSGLTKEDILPLAALNQ